MEYICIPLCLYMNVYVYIWIYVYSTPISNVWNVEKVDQTVLYAIHASRANSPPPPQTSLRPHHRTPPPKPIPSTCRCFYNEEMLKHQWKILYAPPNIVGTVHLKESTYSTVVEKGNHVNYVKHCYIIEDTVKFYQN